MGPYVPGYRGGKTAYGYQKPCRTVLPTSIRTAGKHERADDDEHGEGINIKDKVGSILTLPSSQPTISFRSTLWTTQTQRGERGG